MVNGFGRLTARLLVGLSRRLPVEWLRAINRTMYRTSWGRRALRRVWALIGERPVTIARGPLAGCQFVTGGAQPEYVLGASEPTVQQTLVNCVAEGDVLYDVGANVGFFTLLGARLTGDAGRVYAFEPIEVNVRSLRRNVELNALANVEIRAVAVGDTVGAVRMSLGADQATGHLTSTGDDLVTVPCTTLDAFVAAGHPPPALVKIDVEGAEDLVLAGLARTLRDARPLVLCEIHYGADDPRRDAISAMLAAAEYSELPLDGGSMPHVLAVPSDLSERFVARLGPLVVAQDDPPRAGSGAGAAPQPSGPTPAALSVPAPSSAIPASE